MILLDAVPLVLISKSELPAALMTGPPILLPLIFDRRLFAEGRLPLPPCMKLDDEPFIDKFILMEALLAELIFMLRSPLLRALITGALDLLPLNSSFANALEPLVKVVAPNVGTVCCDDLAMLEEPTPMDI